MESMIVWFAIFICVSLLYIVIDERKRRKRWGKPMTRDEFQRIMATDPYKIIKTKIVDSSHTATTKMDTGSVIGRAIIGGAIAGGVGAIIGASTGKDKVVEKHQTTFIVYYEGGLTVVKTVDNGSKEYNKLIQKVEV